jgi:signal transduction histidine kinase
MAEMPAATSAPRKPWSKEGWRLAAIALAVAGLFLVSLGAVTWWAIQVQNAADKTARTEATRGLGTALSSTAEVMMADGELSVVRRIMADTARDNGLERCRILLPDGRAIADSNPSQINAREFPDVWPAGDCVKEPQVDGHKFLFPMMIADHGPAQLEITTASGQPAPARWLLQAGIGTVAVAALLLLVLLNRYVRSTTRGILAVRQALLAREAGQTSPEALAVNPQWGPEARAWNNFLSTDHRQQRQAALGTMRERLQLHTCSSDHLAAACDVLSQGLVLVGEGLKAEYVNGAAAVLLQTKRDDMCGTTVSDFITDAKVLEAVQAAALGKMVRRTIVEVQRADESGGGLLRFVVRPVRRGDMGVAMVIIEDITQQRVAEESRNAFVAQATHELRTPLTNIRLYTEMALDEGKDNAEIRSNALNIINQETFRLDRMVNDILSIAEIEAGTFSLRLDDVRLDEFLPELERDYVAQVREKNLTMTWNLPPKLPVIKADRGKLSLAMHNLLGNALKYTPEGGRVTVTVTADNGRLGVEVADTGIGIGEEDCQRIFEKFYRAKDPRVGQIKGTGLGLAIAREVTRLHGGDITVHSVIDQGSTFMLTLPITEESV